MDRERYVLFDGFSRGKHIIEQIHLFNYIKKRWREGFVQDGICIIRNRSLVRDNTSTLSTRSSVAPFWKNGVGVKVVLHVSDAGEKWRQPHISQPSHAYQG